MFLLLSACLLYAVSAVPAPSINNAGCGIIPSKHIVGGGEITPYSHPWMVALRRRGSFICGGSLIQGSSGKLYVLTAAHCTAGSNANQLTVDLGRHDLSATETSRQLMVITRIMDHEQYNSNTLANDVSILEMQGQPDINGPYVKPICVAEDPKPDGPNDGDSTVIGWGALFENGGLPSKLHGVDKPVLTDTKCANDVNGFQSASMLCAGFDEGGKDACQGDSGGPLMYYRASRARWDVVGVVSWGYGCARPNLPGVYANVYRLRNWISGKINS